ncbi:MULTISPECIES: response regulator [unclassified Leptolyngbya]|uniref:response regulator n=1 Tax=unclassified Leptolyngbya TaxID=2650499 RepID=UPI001687BD72|nr:MULTISPECIES: response regulator [unclassified Leptolyngbya]MBD1909146.1 response regulator [Leptolyngbya sp. FACHB-8]MBD2157520.1 response regulator [Leptolyngbya sp. FACHB-16]
MDAGTVEKGVILIVDDTPTNLDVLLDVLEADRFKVVIAEDGERAISLAEYAPPDLILLDVLMPGIDGFETCRRLKSNPLTQEIPIIFLTAVSDNVDKVKGLNLGAVDYITKPLNHEEVLARVNTHVRLQSLTRRLTEQNERLEQEIQQRKQLEEEREQAFRALQRSEARFRRLIEANVIGVIFSKIDGSIIDTNDAFLQIVGYDRADLQAGNINWQAMTPAEYTHLNQAAIAELNKTGAFSAFEKEYFRKDGSRIPVMIGGALLDESQQALVGFVLDLTQHKQAQEKIREQAALLDITTDTILVQDLENKIQYWNKGAEHLYGWKLEEIIGQDINHLLYREDAFEQLETAQKSLAKNSVWQGELHQINKQGKEIIVASRWTLMQDAQGQPQSVLIVNTDITEKKQLESQFLRTQRLESLGTLAGGIAHDLNNILTPVLATAQLLQLKFPDADVQSQNLFEILETNTKRGAALVKQVLQFARGVEGKRANVQVKHLIREVRQVAEKTFPKSIKFVIDVESELWLVSGDATHLHQVLMNLVVNARDAMLDGGTLTISAKNLVIDEHYARMNLEASVGAYIELTVKDTGIGMSAEVTDRIFEPFFTTKEIGQGTGLGLSTVRGIVKSHKGFIQVSSKVREGSEFKVFLPAVEVSLPAQAEPSDSLHGDGEWVLVVDDETEILETTRMSLEAYNYRVFTANDGIEAIALCAQHKHKVAVALVDMMMPSMDGLTTIQTLQKIDPQIKAIAISGFVPNDKVKEAHEIASFIAKPYTIQELLQALQTVLRQSMETSIS